MIREKCVKKTNQVRQHCRYQSANIHPSFANIEIESSVSISPHKESHHHFNRVSKKKSTFRPALSHQITPSEKNSCEYISPDFSYCYSQSQTSKPKSTLRAKVNKENNFKQPEIVPCQKKTKNSSRLFISAQYSITLVTEDPLEQPSHPLFKKPCLRNKRPDLNISL